MLQCCSTGYRCSVGVQNAVILQYSRVLWCCAAVILCSDPRSWSTIITIIIAFINVYLTSKIIVAECLISFSYSSNIPVQYSILVYYANINRITAQEISSWDKTQSINQSINQLLIVNASIRHDFSMEPLFHLSLNEHTDIWYKYGDSWNCR